MKLCTFLLWTLLFVVPVAAQDDTDGALGYTYEPVATVPSAKTTATTIATVTVPLKHITATEALDTLQQLGLITDKMFAAPSPDNKAVLMRLKEIPAGGEESPIVEASRVLGSIDIGSDTPTTAGTSRALGDRVAEAELRNNLNQLERLRHRRDELLERKGENHPEVIHLDKEMRALGAAVQQKLSAPLASSPEGKVTINLLDHNLLSIHGNKLHVDKLTQLLESSPPNTASASTDIHRTLAQQAEANALKLAEEIRKQRAADKDDQSLTDQQTKLKQWVRFAFQQRMIYQQLQLDEAERDLKLARERLQRRERLAEKIIERRAEQLERGESAKPQGLEEYLQQDPEYAQYILAIERLREQLDANDASGEPQSEPTREQLQAQIAELHQKLQQRRQELEPRINGLATPTYNADASGPARANQSSALDLPPVKIQVVDEGGNPVSGTQIEMNNADDGRTVQLDGVSDDRGVVIDQPMPYGKYSILATTSQGWYAGFEGVVQFGKGLSLTIVAPKTEELSEVSFVYRAGAGWPAKLKEVPFGMPGPVVNRWDQNLSPHGTGFPTLESGITDVAYQLNLSLTRTAIQPDGTTLKWLFFPRDASSVIVTSDGWWNEGDLIEDRVRNKSDNKYFNSTYVRGQVQVAMASTTRNEIKPYPLRFRAPSGEFIVRVNKVYGQADQDVVKSLEADEDAPTNEFFIRTDLRPLSDWMSIFFDTAGWDGSRTGPESFGLTRPLVVEPGGAVTIELKAAPSE